MFPLWHTTQQIHYIYSQGESFFWLLAQWYWLSENFLSSSFDEVAFDAENHHSLDNWLNLWEWAFSVRCKLETLYVVFATKAFIAKILWFATPSETRSFEESFFGNYKKHLWQEFIHFWVKSMNNFVIKKMFPFKQNRCLFPDWSILETGFSTSWTAMDTTALKSSVWPMES